MRKQVGNNTYIDHIPDQVEKEKDSGVTVDCKSDDGVNKEILCILG